MNELFFLSEKSPKKPFNQWGNDSHKNELKIYFQDKVVGNKQSMRERRSQCKKLVHIECEEGKRLLPKVSLDDWVLKELCSPLDNIKTDV